MSTMKWLIRREFWEHKGSLIWAPLVFGGLIVGFFLINLSFGLSSGHFQGSFFVNGTKLGSLAPLANLNNEQIATVAFVLSNAFMAISAPLFVILAFVVFIYCMNALYDERRDRSILFWKSLPISDHTTVLSKMAIATLAAPLITIAVATATWGLVLLMCSVALDVKGINVFSILLSTPSLYLTPFEVIGLIPVYVLWGLPTFGWLLMVSSWARSKVILWALGVPIFSILLLGWAEKMSGYEFHLAWYAHNIVGRVLLGVVPGAWVYLSDMGTSQLFGTHEGLDMTSVFTHSWATLDRPELWIGAVAGAVMIYVAIRMRRWREEG
jgi:ABC-2 type transport system permease protein